MAISDKERKLAHAYNMGELLSRYEPRLLDNIIKDNKKSEFVQIMAVARDHQDFQKGIPRKDFTTEYKNGFFNSQSLVAHNPQLLDRLLDTKSLHQDYLKGLKAGKQQYQALKAKEKLRNEPKQVKSIQQKDFNKGFNDGYMLQEKYPDVLKYTADTNAKFQPYAQGLQLGAKQYDEDLKNGMAKRTNDRELSDAQYHQRENKADFLRNNTLAKNEAMENSLEQYIESNSPGTGITAQDVKDEYLKSSIEQHDNMNTPSPENMESKVKEDNAADRSEKDKPSQPSSSKRYPSWLKNDPAKPSTSEPNKGKSPNKDIEPDK